MKTSRILYGAVAGFALVAGFAACGGSPRPLETRLWSDSYAFRVVPDPVPPRAVEDVVFNVIVQDKKTGEPIETGRGRIFATSKDRANTNDGLGKAREAGAYVGHLLFPTTGDWAIAIQFQRDSTKPLEKVEWVQSVNNATGDGKQ